MYERRCHAPGGRATHGPGMRTSDACAMLTAYDTETWGSGPEVTICACPFVLRMSASAGQEC